MVGLRGGQQSLRVAEMLAGVPQPVDSGFEGGQRPLAGQRKPGILGPLDLHLPLKGGDLGVTKECRGRVVAGSTTLDHPVMAHELPVAGREGKIGKLALEPQAGRQIGNDGHPLEESCDKAADRTRGPHGVRRPADGSLGEHGGLPVKHGKEVSGEDTGLPLGGLPEGTERLLGDSRVLENNGAAGRPKGRLDGGDLGRGDLDEGGQRARDPGLEELRTVEATKDRLCALPQPLTLALQLQKNLETMFLLGKLLAGGIPLALGDLAYVLGRFLRLLGGHEFDLRGIEGAASRGQGGFGLCGAGGGRRDRQLRHGGLLAQLEFAGGLRVAARPRRGEFSPEVGQAAFDGVQTHGHLLGRLLGDDALPLGIGDPCRGGRKGLLLGAERLKQGKDLGVGLLDFALLLPDAEIHGCDVGTRSLHHVPELTAPLGIRGDAALAGENPVTEGLKAIPGRAGFGVQGRQLLAGSGNLGLLLGDFPLVEGARVGTALHIPGDIGDGALQVKVGAMGEMRVEDAQVLHEGLVAARLSRLALERADLALHFLDDVGDAQEVALGVLQLTEGLFFLRLVLRDPGGLLEDRATVLGAAVEQERGLALLHDGVGAPADAGVHEEIVDVLQAAGRAVDQVLRLAVAEDAARDPDLVPVDAKILLALAEGHGDLGHVVGLAGIGAAEDDIRHLAAAQGLGRLLSKHPADGIKDVGLAATVGTDDRRHPSVKAEDRLGGKGFETYQFKGLKIHGTERWGGWTDSIRSRPLVMPKNTIHRGNRQSSPQDMVVFGHLCGT